MASTIKVDEIKEKTVGSGITLGHALKNSSGTEIMSAAGVFSSNIDGGTISNATLDSTNTFNFVNNSISGDKIDGGTISNATLASSVTFSSFVGLILPFAYDTSGSPPSGFLECDGSPVSRTAYSDLFSAIGTTWGVGDGSTTFNIPDLQGAFLRGIGSHGSSTMANGSKFSGPTNVGDFENDTILSHRHASRSWGDSGGTTPTNPTNGNAKPIQYQQIQVVRETNWSGPYTQRFTDPAIYGDTWTNATSTETNGYNSLNDRKSDETRPFNAGVMYCIKY